MFQLPEVTPVRCTNANPRTELHGKDEDGKEKRVRAMDLTFEYSTENTVLDEIAPGLRGHFYRNKAADAAQEPLPDVVIPLPNIRYPQLKTDEVKWEQPKSRGYRWIWDWGREERHVDFTDAAMGSMFVTLREGGTVDVKFTVSYNGDELNDNEVYGELCGLATMSDVHIQLFAPAELIPVAKGWRSGKADTPQLKDGGGELLDTDPNGELEEQPEGTPEGALAGAIAADKEAQEKAQQQPNGEAAWPFPNSAHEPAKPKSRRGLRGAAV